MTNDSDYTLWRRSIFDEMTSDEIVAGASQYMEDHPLDNEFEKRLKEVI